VTRLVKYRDKEYDPPMKPQAVVKHFGGIVPAATALGVSRQAIYMWLRRRRIPALRAHQIQNVTGGELKANP